MKKILSGLIVFLFFACDTAIPEILSKKILLYKQQSLGQCGFVSERNFGERNSNVFDW